MVSGLNGWVSEPNLQAWQEHVKGIFEASIALKQQILAGGHYATLASMGQVIGEALSRGGKLMVCGNGGSAADAQHLAAELTVRLRPHVNRDGIAAIALATDTSAITACANDYSFDYLYERMLRALGRPGDVVLGITTSGKSPNVLNALKAAKDIGIVPLGFLGGDGGPALPLCDLAFVPPSRETGRIQESHITAGHALMELIEDFLLARGAVRSMA